MKVREIKRFPKFYRETEEKINKAVELYAKDKPVLDIADELGVSFKTVYYYLSAKGVDLKPRKRDNRGRFRSG